MTTFKIAVLSDVHGNLPALETVTAHIEAWQPDVVVVNGDVVNRGPRPRVCWEYVLEKRETQGWLLVSGNHEDYVARWQNGNGQRRGPRFEIDQSAYWTCLRLDGAADQLLTLPVEAEIQGPDGTLVRCTHASMRSNRDGIYPDTPDEELRQQIAPAPSVFCTAHTHHPLLRQIDDTIVVNSGAAGTTFDGDPRASYAQVVWHEGRWQARIIRLAYDRMRAIRDFAASGFREGAGPMVEIFFFEWLTAQPLVNQWARRWETPVLNGEISLEASVQQFLAERPVRELASGSGTGRI